MNKLPRLFLTIALLMILPGCGFIDYFFLPPPEDTAQELFEAGQDAMKEKDYEDAAEYFTKLKDRYPFSPYTPSAELALGDAYFLDERFDEAVDAYKDFESMHPRHERIPYVLYQIGVSNYKQFKSIDMPQEHVAEALEYFLRLAEMFPDDPYAEEAKKYVQKCRRYLAEHEIFVADFYWRVERYGAAWKRYQRTALEFKDLPDVVDYALKRAEIAYLRFQKNRSEKERERIQGSWKQWFDWL
ncbi:MAG: outer membrane protein assembly factor BamD [Thermodesulfobacteriota bacterium]|nr:outer membrane protein assembly factor BamD [Thermodesulfobacteriota bacterium]